MEKESRGSLSSGKSNRAGPAAVTGSSLIVSWRPFGFSGHTTLIPCAAMRVTLRLSRHHVESDTQRAPEHLEHIKRAAGMHSRALRKSREHVASRRLHRSWPSSPVHCRPMQHIYGQRSSRRNTARRVAQHSRRCKHTFMTSRTTSNTTAQYVDHGLWHQAYR